MTFSEAQRGHAAMLLFSFLVAGSFSLGTQVATEISPVALNAVRFAIATMVIGLVAVVTTEVPRSAANSPWRYLVLGGLFSAYFVLMFEGLKTAPAVSASAVFTLTPVLAAGFGWITLRQIMTGRMALALTIGASGALWVIFKADVSALLAFDIGRGEVIYFLGCVFHAIYTPMIRKMNRGEPALVFTFGTLLAGTLVMTVFGWKPLLNTDWSGLRPMVWITILYLAVFATAASFALTQFAAMRLPAAKVMAYTYLTPSWVLLWELAQGHGAPQARISLGIALTVLALILLLKDETPKVSQD